MRAGLKAAAPYFLVVFAAGFVLGTLRVLVLAPALGAVAAVALEVPLMLAVAWFASRWAVARHRVPARERPRLAMGGLAFALLMSAELALGVWGFGQSPAAIAVGFLRPEGMLGLAGQVAFGLVPLAQLVTERGEGGADGPGA
jgi:hypothetical protein